MANPQSILITGANRGLGLEMVKQLLAKVTPQFLFATYRDTKKSEVKFQNFLNSFRSLLNTIKLYLTKNFVHRRNFPNWLPKIRTSTWSNLVGIQTLITANIIFRISFIFPHLEFPLRRYSRSQAIWFRGGESVRSDQRSGFESVN